MILADLTIDEALPSWNEFIGSHFSEYSRVRDRWKILTLAALLAGRGRAIGSGGWIKPEPEDFPLTLLVIVGKKRGVLDSSNIMTKILEDALIPKYLPNDTPEYIEEVRQRSRSSIANFTRLVITTNRERRET